MKKILLFTLFLVVICLLIYFYNRLQIEKYLDYFQLVSVPTDAYKGLDTSSSHKYFTEHDKEFFTKILDKNLSKTKIDIKNFKDINANDESIKSQLSTYIENVFNKEVSDESNLFYTAGINIVSCKRLDDKHYIVVDLILHREMKAYGVSLNMSFYVTNSFQHIEYNAYEIVGFVFEDKIHSVQASNYSEETPLLQQIDNKIIGDPTSEKKEICRYLNNLKKYRNIDNTSDCSQ